MTIIYADGASKSDKEVRLDKLDVVIDGSLFTAGGMIGQPRNDNVVKYMVREEHGARRGAVVTLRDGNLSEVDTLLDWVP
jgi:hypothetical protein